MAVTPPKTRNVSETSGGKIPEEKSKGPSGGGKEEEELVVDDCGESEAKGDSVRKVFFYI